MTIKPAYDVSANRMAIVLRRKCALRSDTPFIRRGTTAAHHDGVRFNKRINNNHNTYISNVRIHTHVIT